MNADIGAVPTRSNRARRNAALRTYLLVICLIAGLMGTYVALLPLVTWSDADTGMPGPGPG